MAEEREAHLVAPSVVELQQVLPDLVDLWEPRNKLVAEGRKQLMLENDIEAPKVAHYKVMKLLMGELRSFLTERQAQFRHDRVVQVLAEGLDMEAEKRATRIEKWIEAALYWMRRTKDTWGLVLADVLIFEGGVERWEADPNTAWPLLIPGDVDGSEEKVDHFHRLLPADPARAAEERENYKKGQPFPITNEYVPLEHYFPARDKDILDFALEVEFRPIRSVVMNEKFDLGAREQFRRARDKLRFNVKQEATIVRYCDDEVYAYYGLLGETDATYNRATPLRERLTSGRPVLLHAYRHGVGRPLYNEVGGAHGGWRASDHALISGRLKHMMHLAQARDDLASQMMTYARNTTWPQMKIKLSMKRGMAADEDSDSTGAPKGVWAGEDMYLYEDEEATPLIAASPNPMFNTALAEVKDQFRMIAGSSALYGQHQPGVATGYQEALLIARAEGQHARVDAGVSVGAANGVYLMLDLVKAMGEKVWVKSVGSRHAATRKRYYEDLHLDPKWLEPLPVLDVSVKAPRPMDLDAMLGAAKTALSENGTPNSALLPRRVVLTEFLGREHPDEDELERRIEQMESEFWASGVPQKLLGEKIGMLSVDQARPAPGTGAMQQAAMDPNFMAQAQAFMAGQGSPAPAAPMGPGPGEMVQPMTGDPGPSIGQGMGGGLAPGQPQPMQTMGREQQVMGGAMPGQMPGGPV